MEAAPGQGKALTLPERRSSEAKLPLHLFVEKVLVLQNVEASLSSLGLSLAPH
jgi:hypothetical protein